jgi:hypothetical protein
MADLVWHQSTRVPFLGNAGAVAASNRGVNGPEFWRLAPRGLLCEKPRCNARRNGFHSKLRLDDKVRGSAGFSQLSQVHGRRLVYPTRPGSLLAFCSNVSQGFPGVGRSSKRCSYFPFQQVASTSSRLGSLTDGPGFPQRQVGRQVTKSRKPQKPLLLLESNITSSFGRLRNQSRRRKVNSRRLVRTLDSLETGGRSERAESSQHRLPGPSSSVVLVDSIAALGAEIGSRPSRASSDATTSEPRIPHNVPPPSVSSTSGSSSIVGLSSKRGEEPVSSIAEVSGHSEAAIQAEIVGSSNTLTVGESGGIDRAGESVSVDTAAEACSTSLTEHREKYWKGLIDTENWEALHLDRAGSVTDAHVLRRKGHLKVSLKSFFRECEKGILVMSMFARISSTTSSPSLDHAMLNGRFSFNFEVDRCSAAVMVSHSKKSSKCPVNLVVKIALEAYASLQVSPDEMHLLRLYSTEKERSNWSPKQSCIVKASSRII